MYMDEEIKTAMVKALSSPEVEAHLTKLMMQVFDELPPEDQARIRQRMNE
jgi:hypothetical protein